MNAEKCANTAILQANTEKVEASKRKSEYDKLIANEKKVVKEKAEHLNDQFRQQWQWIMLILIVYSSLATLFTGFQSERVVSDCASALNTITNIGTSVIDIIIASVDIPKSMAVIFVVVVAGVIAFFGGMTIVNTYRKYCSDEISLFVVLVSIAVLVWFADFMSLNIVLMLILSHIVYIGIRWYIKRYKENH